MTRFLVSLTVGCMLMACNNNTPEQPKQSETPPSGVEDIVIPKQVQKATRPVTGADIDSFFKSSGETYIETMYQTDTPSVYHVVVTTYITPADYDCHSCAPLIKCYEWLHDSSNVSLEKEYSLGLYGSWGKPASVRIKPIGKKEWAYFIEDGYTNMGITSFKKSIIKEMNGKATMLLELEESDIDNSGDCDDKEKPCYTYRSAISLDTTVNTPVYDILIHKKGTILTNDNQVQSIDSLIRYRFDGNRYVRQ